MARKITASKARGNLSEYLAPQSNPNFKAVSSKELPSITDCTGIDNENSINDHASLHNSKFEVTDSRTSDQIFSSSERNKEINNKYLQKLDVELNYLRTNTSQQSSYDKSFDEFWNSDASFASAKNKDAVVRLSTAQTIRFDKMSIEREYPERSTIQLLDDLRLKRLYAKRRENSSEKDAKDALRRSEPYLNLYSDFKEDLNRIGSYAFTMTSNDVDFDKNYQREKDNQPFLSQLYQSGKLSSNLSHTITTSIQPLSPRSAAWKESMKRNLIPIMLEELFQKSRQPYIIHEADDQKIVDVEFDNNKSEIKEGKIDVVNKEVVSINVRGRLLGDDYGFCLGEAIAACPKLANLDISGNRLTDMSIKPILLSVVSHCNCRMLNISDNKIDSASIDILKKFLRDSNCSLQQLRLSKADIDDEECADMMEAIKINTSLRGIDLSLNKIGGMEEYNTVNPDFVTGAEAIASVFEHNKTLVEIDLSWNNIRKDSALTLVRSIAFNNTLQILVLAHNNLGDRAIQYLAEALRSNSMLIKLDVSYNNILPRGIITLAYAIESNSWLQLKDVNINGNQIGFIGGKALFRAARKLASRGKSIKMLFQHNSNLNYQDPTIFDRSEASGLFILNLEDPYQYTVACTLKDIADSKLFASFDQIKYKVSSDAKKWEEIEARRRIVTRKKSISWTDHRSAINSSIDRCIEINNKDVTGRAVVVQIEHQKKLNEANEAAVFSITNMLNELGLAISNELANSIRRILVITHPDKRQHMHAIFRVAFHVVFKMVDIDGSGQIDVAELAQCIYSLGFSKTNSKRACKAVAQRMIAGVDLDGSQSLDEDEFIQLMFICLTDTCSDASAPFDFFLNSSSWEIPNKGILSLSFSCEDVTPSIHDIQSNGTIERFAKSIAKSMSSDDSKIGVLRLCICDDLFLTCEQAEIFIKILKDKRHSLLDYIEHIVLQMVSPVEACRFVAQNLNFEELVDLRRKMGNVFRAVTGNASGHYFLDLKDGMDRLAAKRLAELNNYSKLRSKADHPTRDTSQESNWESFRNATYNGDFIQLTGAWFQKMPTAGKLHFDFVVTSRPVSGIRAASTSAIEKFLKCVFIDCPEENIATGKVKAKLKGARFSWDEILRSLKQKYEIESAEVDQGFTGAKRDQLKDVASAPKDKLTETDTKKMNPQKSNTKRRDGAFFKVKEAAATNNLTMQSFLNRSSESYLLFWNSYISTTWSNYCLVYSTMLNGKIKEAVANDSNSTSSQNGDEDVTGKAGLDIHNSAYNYKIYKDARMNPIHSAAVFRVNNTNQDSKQSTGFKLKSIDSKSMMIQRCATFELNLQLLEVFICYNFWLSTEQAITIIDAFKAKAAPDLVISRCITQLFPRIVDLENFVLVLNSCSPALKKEVIHRIGILNVWCPMMADGPYEFDLASKDHREAAIIVIRLAAIEPGQNMLGECYARSLIEPQRPGFEIPLSWTQASPGPATFGLFGFTYTSDASYGCEAMPIARKELTIFRCLAGSRGSFSKGFATSNELNAKSPTHKHTLSSNVAPHDKEKLDDLMETVDREELAIEDIPDDFFQQEFTDDIFFEQKFSAERQLFRRATGKL